MDKWLKDILPD